MEYLNVVNTILQTLIYLLAVFGIVKFIRKQRFEGNVTIEKIDVKVGWEESEEQKTTKRIEVKNPKQIKDIEQ